MLRGERRETLRTTDRRAVVRTPGRLKDAVDAVYELVRRQDYLVKPPAMWIGVPGVGCMMLTAKSIKVMVGDDSYRDATEEEKKKLDKFMNGGK